MAEAFRRVILKPAGLGEKDAAKLREALSASVARQRQLSARSPHILAFLGELEESADAFYVAHEPAVAVSTAEWFGSAMSPMDEPDLLRWAVALFDALRAAHTIHEARSAVHGGLCGGVLLISPEGIEKVSDFGFAPGLCRVLGTESYVNLAVGARAAAGAGWVDTAIWEVLDPDVADRDDRICSFVDPEKYGAETLDSFEPGSDVVAAGFILHYLAEHRHAYLSSDPDAHRVVWMAAQFMGMSSYNGARRKKLRESADSGVQAWCDCVAKALARLPQDRPSAEQALAMLARFVKPVDAGEIARRRLEDLSARVRGARPEELEWDDVRKQAEVLSACETLAPDAVRRAQALVRQARAYIDLSAVEAMLAGERWIDAGDVLQGVRDLLDASILTPELDRRLRDASERFEQCSVLQRELADIEGLAEDDGAGAAVEGPDETDAEAVHARLAGLMIRVNDLSAPAAVPDSLRTRVGQLQALLAARTERAEAEARRLAAERQADHDRAAEWIAQAQAAWDSEQLDKLRALLDQRPTLRHWPAGARETAEALRRGLEDRRRSREWLEQAEAAAAEERWEDADELLRAAPAAVARSPEVHERARQLQPRVRKALREREDHARARRWIEELERPVHEEQWKAAADVLARRPALEYWPAEVLEAETRLRPLVEERAEALDLQQRRIEAEHRQARDWLEQARDAAERSAWMEVQSVLSHRPPLQHWPPEVPDEAVELERRCGLKLGEEILEQLQARSHSVRMLAERLVRQVVTETLDGLVDPKGIQTTIDAEELTSDRPDADGRARLRVRLTEAGSENGVAAIPFDFLLGADPPRICEDGHGLRDQVAEQLKSALTALQKLRADGVSERLRQGLLRQARLEWKLELPGRQAGAAVDLLGSGTADAKVEAQFVWDAVKLDWGWANAAAFNREVLEIARRLARNAVAAKLLEACEYLRPYKSLLALEVALPDSSGPGLLPASLALEGRLSIHPGKGNEALALQTFPVTCTELGQAGLPADLTAARNALRQLVVSAQNTDRDAIAADLQGKMKAASAKIKVNPSPKQIKEPTDSITFELKPASGPAVALAGLWEPEAFAYVLPPDAAESITKLLSPPESPAIVPPPKPPSPRKVETKPPKSARAEPARDKTHQVGGGSPRRLADSFGEKAEGGTTGADAQAMGNKSRTKRLGVAAVVVVGLVAAVTAVVWFAGPGDPNSNANSNGHSSRPNDDEIDPPINSNGSGQSTTNGTGPGPELAPVAPPVHPDSTPPPPAEFPKLAGQRIRVTDKTVKPEVVAAVFENPALKSFVESSQADLEFTSDGTWNEAEDKSSVAASGVEAQIVLKVSGESGETSELRIADLLVNVETVAGAVRSIGLSSGTEPDLTAGIKQLAQLQEKSVGDLLVELKRETAALECKVEGPDLPVDELSTNGVFDVTSCEGLQPRRIDVLWDPKKLEFNKQTLLAKVKLLQRAHNTLKEINTQIRSDHWVRKASSGVLEERDAPALSSWTLAVLPPWADDVNGAEPNRKDYLIPLPIEPNPLLTDEDPQAVARRLLENGGWHEPAEWALVQKYASYRSDPNVVKSDLAQITAMRKLSEVQGFMQVRFRLADRQKAITPSSLKSRELQLAFAGQWTLDHDEHGQPPFSDALHKALEGQFPYQELMCILKLDGQGGTVLSAPGAGGLEGQQRRAQLMNTELSRLPERHRVEDLLKLNQRGTRPLTKDEAFAVLKDIWKAKGITSQKADLDALISQIQDRRISNKRRNPKPTVFVEYFCGPRSTYALVWSARDPTVTLLNLCDTHGLVSQPAEALGARLLNAVWDAVPKAINPDPPKQLGLVLAPDDYMSVLGESLDKLIFQEQKSELPRDGPTNPVALWRSLHELRAGKDNTDRPGDYWLVASLALPGKDWKPKQGDELWAIKTVVEAGP